MRSGSSINTSAIARKSLNLWIVVPCYNEEEVLPELSRRLTAKLGSLMDCGAISSKSRILLVDDGSRDATWNHIVELHEGSFPGVSVAAGQICGLKLAHNVGQQHALFAGLMYALRQGCDCEVSLDADLQDDIDAIDEMLQRHADWAEIVYGVRENRDVDTRFKRSAAKAFYGAMRFLRVEMVPDAADFRLMGKRSLEALSEYGESNLFLRGIVPTLGYTAAKVYYRRGERFDGKSKYPINMMLSFSLDGITSFSIAPVRLITLIGILAVLFSAIMILYALLSLVAGHVVAGWTSLMISIWLIGGLIIIALGVVGEYVGKTYLEAKARPRYIIEETLDWATTQTDSYTPRRPPRRGRPGEGLPSRSRWRAGRCAPPARWGGSRTVP